jgi:hypothetical protein
MPSSAWICGECSRPEELNFSVAWACHHCGKILCKDCKREMLADAAFSGPVASPSRRAVHCAKCWTDYHTYRRQS